jgi:chemotaxis response regulator CheB
MNILLLHLTAVDMDPTATSALRLGFASECDEVAKPRNGERKQMQQNEEETRKAIEKMSRKKTERGEREKDRQESNRK